MEHMDGWWGRKEGQKWEMDRKKPIQRDALFAESFEELVLVDSDGRHGE
jgi:hypothetical protein